MSHVMSCQAEIEIDRKSKPKEETTAITLCGGDRTSFTECSSVYEYS